MSDKTISWQGLTAEEISSIHNDEFRLQKVEQILKERNASIVKDLTKAVEIIKDFQNSDVPPCKFYEDTYSDGWMDACNEILWAIEEELGVDQDNE